MASPIYGTQAAGYMNVLAGRARGMAEAERMRRMQEQQDFGNAYQMLGMQDRVQARDQARADEQSWNAYNAAMQQRAFDNKYNFDVYDRAVAGDRYQDQQRMLGEQFDYKKQMDRAELSRALSNDQWGQFIDLQKLAPRPPKPLDADEAGKMAALQATAYNPNVSPEERAVAQDALALTGASVYREALDVQSRKSGLAGRFVEGVKTASPLSWIFGDSIRENSLQAGSGYSSQDLMQEMQDTHQALIALSEYEQSLPDGQEMPPQLLQRYEALRNRYNELQGAANHRLAGNRTINKLPEYAESVASLFDYQPGYRPNPIPPSTERIGGVVGYIPQR